MASCTQLIQPYTKHSTQVCVDVSGVLEVSKCRLPVRVKVKDIPMAKAQKLLILLWGDSSLAGQPDQLVLTGLRWQHSIALVTWQV